MRYSSWWRVRRAARWWRGKYPVIEIMILLSILLVILASCIGCAAQVGTNRAGRDIQQRADQAVVAVEQTTGPTSRPSSRLVEIAAGDDADVDMGPSPELASGDRQQSGILNLSGDRQTVNPTDIWLPRGVLAFCVVQAWLSHRRELRRLAAAQAAD